MGQIFVSILVVVVTWMAFKSLRAFNQSSRESMRGPKQKPQPRTGGQEQAKPVEAMRECPACNTFRPVSKTSSCGRQNCPYGGSA